MAGFITDFFGYSSEDASEKALEYAAKKRCPILGTSCSKLLARSNEPSGACAIRQITSSSPDVICCPIRLYSDEYKILRIVAERAFGTNLPLYAGRAAVEEAIRTGRDGTEYDQAFHQAIVSASLNDFLIRLVPIINRAVMEAIQLRSMETVLEEITLQDHALLMEFMKARDAAGAKQAMAIHLHRAINHLHLQAEMELPPFSAC